MRYTATATATVLTALIAFAGCRSNPPTEKDQIPSGGASVPEKAKAASKQAPKPKNPDAWTLGRLVTKIKASDDAYQDNVLQADEIERKQGSAVASQFRVQIELFRFNPADVPGIDGLRALCNLRYGTEVTGSALLKIRGELCAKKGLTIDQANQMDIEDVADSLKP